MKKLVEFFWIAFFLFIFSIVFPVFIVYASDEQMMEQQQEELGIQDFLKDSKQYLGDFFEDIDMSEVLNDAVKGEVDNASIGKRIFSLLGSEVVASVKAIGSILVIIVIHSILKAISESLQDDGISKLIYYVQYILIITIIMANFSDIVKLVQATTTNLVAFMNMLIPLLITLMMSTGSIATSGVIEPIILFMINFIGNLIQDVILPLLMIFTAIVIISKLSNQVRIDKLSKFLNSGIVWFLGIILTVFVGVVSLEGTMVSSVDRNYSQNYKSSGEFSNSSSRKNTRRCSRYRFGMWCYFKKCSRTSWCYYYFRNLYSTNYKIRNLNICL